MKMWKMLAVAAVAMGAAACANSADNAGDSVSALDSAAMEQWSAIDTAVRNNPARTAEDMERDAFRHPVEALAFWDLQPGATILEVQPGGGWWTRILGPFARDTGGQLYVTAADLDNPELSAGARAGREAFEAEYVTSGRYGPVQLVNWGARSAPLPANTFDFILSARNFHGWIGAGMVDKAMGEFFAALKPGGVLAIEQHRAAADVTDPQAMASSGYVSEAYVIAAAERAGFVLDGTTELNANPADTRDHPFGVWTLPPVARTSPFGQPADPTFDRTRYDAIGESDRMTLRFRKPAAA